MKQSNITPKVIELSKEIAEYWAFNFYRGMWVSFQGMGTPILITELSRWKVKTDSLGWIKKQDALVIPSISDCLEKLSPIFGEIELNRETDAPYNWYVGLVKEKEYLPYVEKSSQSLHEALLSALLEVLKGGKK